MDDLTKEEVVALGHAVGLEIQDPELTEITYSLNALLEALDAINPPGWRTLKLYPLSCLRNEGIVPGPLGRLLGDRS